MGMARVNTLLAFGIVLMAWGVVHFVLGYIHHVFAMIIWAMVLFFVGYSLVLGEVIISREESNKDRGGGDE